MLAFISGTIFGILFCFFGLLYVGYKRNIKAKHSRPGPNSVVDTPETVVSVLKKG